MPIEANPKACAISTIMDVAFDVKIEQQFC